MSQYLRSGLVPTRKIPRSLAPSAEMVGYGLTGLGGSLLPKVFGEGPLAQIKTYVTLGIAGVAGLWLLLRSRR